VPVTAKTGWSKKVIWQIWWFKLSNLSSKKSRKRGIFCFKTVQKIFKVLHFICTSSSILVLAYFDWSLCNLFKVESEFYIAIGL